MTDSIDNIVSGTGLVASVESAGEMALDGRRPVLLDHHGHVLEIVAGHADIFAVEIKDGKSGGRHHLFRIERGDIIPDLPGFPASSPDGLRFIAVGAQNTRVSVVPRDDLASADQAVRWIERLARFVAGRCRCGRWPSCRRGRWR